MLIRCCSCKKEYDLEGNIFEYEKGSRYPILICPYCGLRHIINFMLFDNKIEKLKKIEKLDLTLYYPSLGASRIADANRVDKSLADDVPVTGWDKTKDFILATRIYGSKGTYNYAYTLKWRNVTDGGSFAAVGATGEISYSAATDLTDGGAVTTKICGAQTNYTWQNGLASEGDNILPDTGTFALLDEYYTELQWALDCDGAHDGDVYEFALYTNAIAIGTCLATLGVTWDWISPTGFVDGDNKWNTEANAYDENTDTYAQSSVPATSWSSYLELKHSAISCSKVRFWADYSDSGVNKISVDVYYGGAWVLVYEGAYTDRVWIEKEILTGTQTVTAMRAKFYNINVAARNVVLYEVDFWGVAALTVINIAAIPGVTVPVTDAIPVATITETAQYTGTVTWNPAHNPFQGSTIYTATITLTAKAGFTLTGVAENFFTVTGATTVTNPANSGVVTAIFPETVAAGDFECVGTGSFAYSGTATQSHSRYYLTTAEGQFAYSGSATQVYSKDYLTSGSGELAFSGEVVQIHTKDFSYITSGNFTFNGIGIYTLGFVYIGSGILTYSGEAEQSYTKDFVYIADGTLTFSGAGTYLLGFAYTSSGTITYSGTATVTVGFTYIGSGEFAHSGSAITTIGFAYIGNGILTYSGEATQSFIFNYLYSGSGEFTYSGTVTLVYTTDFLYTTSGNFVFSGSASYSIGSEFSYVGSGKFVYSGTATQIHTRDYLYTGSGGFTYSGEAVQSYTLNFETVGIGSYSFSGSGSYILGISYIGSGQFVYSGNAVITIGFAYSGSGEFIYSGEAILIYIPNYLYVGSGMLIYSGTAIIGAVYEYEYIGSGQFIFSGTAFRFREIIIFPSHITKEIILNSKIIKEIILNSNIIKEIAFNSNLTKGITLNSPITKEIISPSKIDLEEDK